MIHFKLPRLRSRSATKPSTWWNSQRCVESCARAVASCVASMACGRATARHRRRRGRTPSARETTKRGSDAPSSVPEDPISEVLRRPEPPPGWRVGRASADTAVVCVRRICFRASFSSKGHRWPIEPEPPDTCMFSLSHNSPRAISASRPAPSQKTCRARPAGFDCGWKRASKFRNLFAISRSASPRSPCP